MRHICTLPSRSLGELPPLPPNATWCQKWVRRWRNLILVSYKHPKCYLYFKSSISIAMERQKHIDSKYRCVIHPLSEFSKYYQVWMLCIFYMALFFHPVDALFDTDPYGYDVLSILCFIIDICCLIDVGIRFFTGYIDEDKKINMKPKKIVYNYLSSKYFFVDLLSSLPVDMTIIVLYQVYGYRIVSLLPRALNMLKLFRCKTMVQYYKDTAELLVRKMLEINEIGMRIIGLLGTLLLTVNWLNCLQYFILKLIKLFYVPDPRSWLVQSGLEQKTTSHDKYILCLHRTNALLMGVHHKSSNQAAALEDIFICIAYFIFGYLFWMYYTVAILQIVVSYLSLETKYQQVVNELKGYMTNKALPPTMQQRFLMYYDYAYQKDFFKESKITNLLSGTLRSEIKMHSCRKLIENVKLFANLPQNIVIEIVSNLRYEIFLPNDLIIKAGTFGDAMYFISTGTVCIITPSGKEICHLQDGSYFGEIGILVEEHTRRANVVAIEICGTFRLDRKSFKRCFLNSQELYDEIAKTAQKRMYETTIVDKKHQKYMMETSMAHATQYL